MSNNAKNKLIVKISPTLFGRLTFLWYVPFIRLIRSCNDDYAEQLVVNLTANFKSDFKKYFKTRVKQVD